MGKCRYCGKPAGFFKKAHKHCEVVAAQKHRERDNQRQRISELFESAIRGDIDVNGVFSEVANYAASKSIKLDALPSLAASAWEDSVQVALEDDLLSEEEEKVLSELAEMFKLSKYQLDKNGAQTTLVKAATLRDLMKGEIPQRIKVQGNLPFNFQKTEKLIWVFQDVSYFEQKKRTQYVGGSQGVSLRVAKGVYYRMGSFKGHKVESHETIHADTGLMGVTNKHIYFSGATKSFRVRLDKIVSFEPFSDGIGIQRDAATAKPQQFKTGDGWFTYNLVMNASQL